ncbi:MAG: CHAT domain-containing protein [Salinibacter sp.]|uniref:CHAT domain-containing protein n=1 Tax=Salinibacter sp. TaxID=2065818 RepID=UPI0035D4B929
MLALVLGALLSIAPPDSTDGLGACLNSAPSQSEPPITWESDIQRMWARTPPVPPDTLRAYLSQYREARACLQALNPSKIEHPYLGNIIRTFHKEAALLAGLRRFSDAFDALEAARSYLKSASSIPSSENTRTGWPPGLHQDQGYLHYLLGDLSSAIDHYLKALQETPEDQPGERVVHLLDIGVLHQRMQDYRTARRYYRQARHLFREHDTLADEHPSKWARLLQNQTDLLLEQTLNTQFDAEALKRARNLAQKGRAAASPETERYVRLSMLLSECLGYLDRFVRAYDLIEEVRRSDPYRNDVRLQTYALLKLGVLHVQSGRLGRAESALKRSLRMAETVGALDYQRRALRALGRLHELRSEWTEAESYYRDGVAVVEKYIASLTASQWSTTAFAQWRDVHRGLVRALLAQNRDREALSALDRSRARHLQNLRIRARVANQLPLKQRARFDSLSRALTNVRTRLGRGERSDSAQTALRTREARLVAARQQALEIESKPGQPQVREIQAALAQKNRALISYFLDDPWPVYERSPRSTAFVVTEDTLRAVPLPHLTQDSVRRQIGTISPLFQDRDNSSHVNAMHFDLRPLHNLQEVLYAPVAKFLPEDRPLTIVPNGPLFRIPFSMLVRSMPESRYAPSEARFLLHERPTTLELASSMVVDSTRGDHLRGPSARAELAAFGVSTFDTLRAVPAALRASLSPQSPDSAVVLPDLPGVRKEIRTVQQRVEGTRAFLNEAATGEAVRKVSKRVSVLHLASHAFVHSSDPLQNAFLLRPDSSRTGSDGVLFLHELQTWRRPLSLVVLSGCNTARGPRRSGEGMEGLQYAFRAMGAEATLSSLWPVADEANVELIDAFYRHLQNGLRLDEALRQAKLEYLEEHPTRASPFFWASSVLYGSPARLELESPRRSPAWAWWGVGLAAIVLGVLALWRWRTSPSQARSRDGPE